jgi:hypothetical protein
VGCSIKFCTIKKTIQAIALLLHTMRSLYVTKFKINVLEITMKNRLVAVSNLFISSQDWTLSSFPPLTTNNCSNQHTKVQTKLVTQ